MTPEHSTVDREAAASREEASGDLSISHGGVSLRLVPERAAFVEATRTLLVADLHLDKPEAYRREGVAMPEGILEETLARLASVLARLDPAEVVVLGDLLHSRRGADPRTADRFAAWRSAHSVPMRLVGGNHDRAAARHLGSWSIEDAGHAIALEVDGGGLRLRHDPEGGDGGSTPSASSIRETSSSAAPSSRTSSTGTASSGGSNSVASSSEASRPASWPSIAGHWHPMASLVSGTRRLLLPCFHASASALVLPAFTAFASGVRVQPAPGERVYAIAERRVIEVTRAFG